MKQPFLMLIVQLRRLGHRGHKSNQPKRQRAPFWLVRLMLVGPEQAASAFLVTTFYNPSMQVERFGSCR